ncbi:hypothetical protein SAMN04515671_0117 [Nakamurella panacisegetis]|uniref:Acyl-CoA carboxylase epsilon subunit n=1 Tax=Nakamurella panacisegetis TaxID=1090615 RepID=A0A1H0HLR4_9ACTN|nr:hypothetical protein [Nakamurella panacisegetis]SDO19973.1 hypothetical protein SAMN04515671_0117 [Nakamurella panacisegetis]
MSARPDHRDEDDVAAVIAVLSALAASVPAPEVPAPRSFFARQLGPVSPQTPGAWWASGLPR